MKQDDGSGIPKLGIIAACQLDGSLSFYAVPQPEELRQKTGAAEGATLYCEWPAPNNLATAIVYRADESSTCGQTITEARSARCDVHLCRFRQWWPCYMWDLDG